MSFAETLHFGPEEGAGSCTRSAAARLLAGAEPCPVPKSLSAGLGIFLSLLFLPFLTWRVPAILATS